MSPIPFHVFNTATTKSGAVRSKSTSSLCFMQVDVLSHMNSAYGRPNQHGKTWKTHSSAGEQRPDQPGSKVYQIATARRNEGCDGSSNVSALNPLRFSLELEIGLVLIYAYIESQAENSIIDTTPMIQRAHQRQSSLTMSGSGM